MVHLRNGTPEHRMEYHLLLSDLIPFDQNNCRLHRYHQFCHRGWHHQRPPSQRACSGFQGIRFLDQIKCESLHLRKSLRAQPPSNHHIHCFNATDILFTCSAFLAFIFGIRQSVRGACSASDVCCSVCGNEMKCFNKKNREEQISLLKLRW